ncbi:hypothetical protein RSOLAG1IB_11180 [Rhizoctonia solani AG-1 IB]|uniref:Uncharacterized protein n=1 Tax=Thanatephorus cucumeris (strain AG1-IB / isolate 7/3/14) TaxID=1108050 RepID=A0A0B7F5L6_THACB|nr:hypothetical protein RSOLAG1IB_11180 [Rhizoctonia solani AG-1 IB]
MSIRQSPAPYSCPTSCSCNSAGRYSRASSPQPHAQMATPSQPTITPGQPQHQGFGTPFGEALAHLGSTTLDDICNLLHHLITSVSKLSTRVAETEEATKDVQATVENISQQVNIIAGKVDKPRTPEQANPTTMVDQTPRPGISGKSRVKLEPPANLEWHSVHSDDKSGAEDPAPMSSQKTSGNDRAPLDAHLLKHWTTTCSSTGRPYNEICVHEGRPLSQESSQLAPDHLPSAFHLPRHPLLSHVSPWILS